MPSPVTSEAPALPAHQLVATGISQFKPGHASGGFYRYQWGLNLTLEGRARWSYEGVEHETRRGDLLLSPPPMRSAWQVVGEENWVTLYAAFRPRTHWHEWLSQYQFVANTAILHLHNEELLARVQQGLERANRTYLHVAVHREEWTLWELEQVLLALHSHYALQRAVPDARVEAALQFIHAHFTEPLTMRDIARAAFLSASRLSLLFGNQLGMPPMEYLEHVRLTRAGEMLRFGSGSIREVSAAVGYRDPDYFCRRFTRFAGVSPRRYRADCREG